MITKLGAYLLAALDAVRSIFDRDDSSTKGWSAGDIINYNNRFR